MKSRMERYYESNTPSLNPSRTEKNRALYENDYKGDYDLKNYSNIEGFAEIDKTNEINIDKLKALLKKREEEKELELPHLIKRSTESKPLLFDDKEEKKHDLTEILKEAKSERKNDDKQRNLNNTQFDILKNINMREEQENEELNDLINTITNTSILNKLADKELSLNLLDDLKSNDNTSIVSPSDIKDAIKSQNNSYESTNELSKIDKSFYTSSLGFTSDDFEQLRDIQATIKTNNRLIKFLVFILALAIVAGIIFLVYNLKGQV